MKIRCRSCGAEFDDSLAACPYCGAVNEKGAEKEYMDKLDDIHDDMSELSDDGIEQAAETTKKTGKIIAIAAIVTVLLVVVIAVIGIMSKAKKTELMRQQTIWQNQNFKKFDSLYEAGDYDKLFAEIESHKDDEAFTMYRWDHYDFYNTYVYCAASDSSRSALASGEIQANDKNNASLLYGEMRVRYNYTSEDLLKDDEKFYLAESAERSINDLKERWSIDDSNFDSTWEELADGRYLNYNDVKKYIKEHD